jgi:hypothetical protein
MSVTSRVWFGSRCRSYSSATSRRCWLVRTKRTVAAWRTAWFRLKTQRRPVATLSNNGTHAFHDCGIVTWSTPGWSGRSRKAALAA